MSRDQLQQRIETNSVSQPSAQTGICCTSQSQPNRSQTVCKSAGPSCPRNGYLRQSLGEDASFTASIEAEKLPHLQQQRNGVINTGEVLQRPFIAAMNPVRCFLAQRTVGNSLDAGNRESQLFIVPIKGPVFESE